MYDDTRTESLYTKQSDEIELQGYLITGTVLSGRYKVDGILGHGGFGITYKAWDTVLEKYVAIKEYYPVSVANRGTDGKSISVMTQNDKKEFEEGVDRFLREARDVSKFSTYNNIVSIYDFFKENSTAYMVMEYLEGQTLKEYMEGQNDIDENLQSHIIFSILDVLETIHSNGLIHRDISPDNVFVCNNNIIKIIDFGAAKNDTQNDLKTVSVVLKKGYAPIEQYSTKSIVSPKVDIYAFGATMYYLLTGVVPVPSVDRVISDDLEEPKKLNPNISDEWNKVILKCMEIKAEDRYSTVEEIRRDLMKKEDENEEKKIEEKKFIAGNTVENSFVYLNNNKEKSVANKKNKKSKKKEIIISLLAIIALSTVGILIGLKIYLSKNALTSELINKKIYIEDNGFLYVDDSLFGKSYNYIEKLLNIELYKYTNDRTIENEFSGIKNEENLSSFDGEFYCGFFNRNSLFFGFKDGKLAIVLVACDVKYVFEQDIIDDYRKAFKTEPVYFDNDENEANFSIGKIDIVCCEAFPSLGFNDVYVQYYIKK